MQKKNLAKTKVVASASKSNSYSWIWYVVGVLVILVALFVVYKSLTADVIVTGNPVKESVNNIWNDYARPVLEYAIGYNVSEDTTYRFKDFFSMSLLILIIVFSVVFLVVSSAPFFRSQEHPWIVWILTIAVSLLAVRFLTENWLITILLPYSTLGIAISAGLPFVLFFFLVDKFKSDTLKKIAWFFFGLIFLYLYYDRTSTTNQVALSVGPYYSIYLWTAIAALFMFLVGQKAGEKIKKKIKKEKGEKEMGKAQAQKEYRKLHEVQQNLKSIMDQNGSETDVYRRANAKWKEVTTRLSELQQIVLD